VTLGQRGGEKLGSGGRPIKIGETKRCRVCGLPNARNVAALPKGHSRQEHEALRVRPPSVPAIAPLPFDAPRLRTPRRWQRA
jgi:hypothetical protein